MSYEEWAALTGGRHETWAQDEAADRVQNAALAYHEVAGAWQAARVALRDAVRTAVYEVAGGVVKVRWTDEDALEWTGTTTGTYEPSDGTWRIAPSRRAYTTLAGAWAARAG